jgi:glycine betaine/proline transport system substrate-binding protein
MKLSIRIIAVLAVVALVAAACGDDEPQTTQPPATTAPPATQAMVDDSAMEEAQTMMDEAQAMMDEAAAAAAEAEAMSEEDQAMMEEAQAEAQTMMDEAQAMMDEAAAAAAEAEEAAKMEAAKMEAEAMMLPGEGVSLTMARANWSTGYFQAELVRQLMQMLGYEVSDPSDLELGPNLGYLAMAQGEADFWVNSWYPGHNSWLAAELADGSLVGEHVRRVGELMLAGGLQGYLITKTFAEEYGISTIDDLNNNPDAIAAYDAQDPNPGNGKANIYGCPESWTCDDIIQSQIAFSGWENIEQVVAGYDAMFAEAAAKADAGEPMVAYTWTPSSYITQLRPGDNVVWVGVESVLDNSNPLGRDGGEEWDQRPGTSPAIGAEACPSAADDGVCDIGWVAADVIASARHDMLANHPAAAKLLEVVKLNVVDVSLQIVRQDAGEDVGALVTQWIADNQAQVDAWIAEAKAVA